jgi:hypothetical protein
VLERGVAHEVAGGVEGTEVEGPGRRPSGGKLRDGELVDGPAAPAAMTGRGVEGSAQGDERRLVGGSEEPQA